MVCPMKAAHGQGLLTKTITTGMVKIEVEAKLNQQIMMEIFSKHSVCPRVCHGFPLKENEPGAKHVTAFKWSDLSIGVSINLCVHIE